MEHHAGIDASLESASLCIVDATGRIIREAKVASEPGVLIGWFRALGLAVTRIGLEAGPLFARRTAPVLQAITGSWSTICLAAFASDDRRRLRKALP